MKKFGLTVFVLLCVGVCVCLVGCHEEVPSYVPPLSTDGCPFLADFPLMEDIVMPDENDAEGMKALAYLLYERANRRDQSCAYRLAYSFCNVTTEFFGVAMPVPGCVYDVKNGDEYYKLDFQPTKSMAAGHGKATYYKLGLPKAYYIKVDDSRIDEAGQGSADFSKPSEAKYVDAPYFHASQDPLYCKTDINILPETIVDAHVSYNAEKGYYTVTMTLDVENPVTTEKTLENLRAGSSMVRKANYTSIEETFEVWANGFFKYFVSIDKWATNSISGTIDYKTYYSYEESECVVSSYQHYEEMKRKAEEQ